MSGEFEKFSVPVKLVTAGTAACIADFISFPLDTAKVRLQIQGQAGKSVHGMRVHTGEFFVYQDPAHYRGLVRTIGTIAKEEGFRSLYNGLNAGLQRQMCFASVRLGMYEPVKTRYQSWLRVGEKKGGVVDMTARIMAGLTTGAMAVMVAQPTEVVKVRFQATVKPDIQICPPDGVKHVTWQAYKNIFRQEGLGGLWRGTVPNMGRNAIVNVAEIVCYDVVKEKIIKSGMLEDNIPCHFTSAVIAGFCATLCASPVDVIKTRYMDSARGTYKGVIDCAVQTVMKEGPKAFYKGFFPSFSRLVSWNILMWVTYEQLKLLVVEKYPTKTKSKKLEE